MLTAPRICAGSDAVPGNLAQATRRRRAVSSPELLKLLKQKRGGDALN